MGAKEALELDLGLIGLIWHARKRSICNFLKGHVLCFQILPSFVPAILVLFVILFSAACRNRPDFCLPYGRRGAPLRQNVTNDNKYRLPQADCRVKQKMQGKQMDFSCKPFQILAERGRRRLHKAKASANRRAPDLTRPFAQRDSFVLQCFDCR